MDEYNHDDNRESLYQEFKETMTLRPTEAYYDESDLIEIFDYAGDRNDDATRIEVIALAAKLHPESQAIKARKALFYFYADQPEVARSLLAGPHEQGVIWDILEARLNNPTPKDMPSILSSIVEKYAKFEDEEIIQFVDLANSFNQMDWVLEHIKELKSKTPYTPTLLYEVAITSGLNEDYDTVIKMMEELTSIEPFYVPYWVMLAKAQSESANPQEAITALDYALAIDPSCREALLMKAQLSMLLGENVESLIEPLARIVKDEPEEIAVIHTLAMVYSAVGRNLDAVALYIGAMVNDRANRELMEGYLEYTEEATFSLLSAHYKATAEPDEDTWLMMASKQSIRGRHLVAAQVLEAFHLMEGLTYGFQTYVMELYLAGRYKDVEKLLTDGMKGPRIYSPFITPMVGLVYAFAMVRNGRSRKVVNFIEQWIQHNKKSCFPTPADRVANTGVSYYLHTLLDWMEGETDESLDSLDPLHPIITPPAPEMY